MKQPFCKENHQLQCSRQNRDDTTVNFEPHLLIIAKANNVKLPAIDDFMLAPTTDMFREQMKKQVRTSHFLFES